MPSVVATLSPLSQRGVSEGIIHFLLNLFYFLVTSQ